MTKIPVVDRRLKVIKGHGLKPVPGRFLTMVLYSSVEDWRHSRNPVSPIRRVETVEELMDLVINREPGQEFAYFDSTGQPILSEGKNMAAEMAYEYLRGRVD